MNELNLEPNFDIDALLQCDSGPDLLCNVKVWLPLHAGADARIQVEAPISPEAARLRPFGSAKLVSLEHSSNELPFLFEASQVLVRNSSTRMMAIKTGRTTFTIGHIGKIRTTQLLSVNAPETTTPPVIDSMKILLSDFSYGLPTTSPYSDYKGNRTLSIDDVRALRMKLVEGAVCKLELHHRWSWTNLEDGRVLASSVPTMVLVNSNHSHLSQIDALVKTGEDACVLLTLAARHRVCFHGYDAVSGGKVIQEWLSPLSRNRAITEEEACGPLVNESELEEFFEAASERWCSFDLRWRDAVRHAVFSVHPLTKHSVESGFLGMFAALEGLAGVCSPNLFRLEPKIKALLEKYPPRIGGLWPLVLADKDIGLNWFRDEIAHGRQMQGERFAALVLAADHLQLWIEQLLLAVLNCRMGNNTRDHLRNRNRTDYLRQQVQQRSAEVTEFQKKLSASL